MRTIKSHATEDYQNDEQIHKVEYKSIVGSGVSLDKVLVGTIMLLTLASQVGAIFDEGTIYSHDAFLLSKNYPANYTIDLPPNMDYTCELLLIIEVTETGPGSDPPEIHNQMIDGKITFTAENQDFQHGSEKFTVFAHGKETRVKKSICFTENCEKKSQKTFNLSAKTDIVKFVDVNIRTTKGLHVCQPTTDKEDTDRWSTSSLVFIIVVSIILNIAFAILITGFVAFLCQKCDRTKTNGDSENQAFNVSITSV